MGTVRRVCRNVKHWRSPSMAMRWTAAAMIEVKMGFRRLKAHNQLPALRAALDRKKAAAPDPPLAQIDEAAWLSTSSARSANFNTARDIPAPPPWRRIDAQPSRHSAGLSCLPSDARRMDAN